MFSSGQLWADDDDDEHGTIVLHLCLTLRELQASCYVLCLYFRFTNRIIYFIFMSLTHDSTSALLKFYVKYFLFQQNGLVSYLHLPDGSIKNLAELSLF